MVERGSWRRLVVDTSRLPFFDDLLEALSGTVVIKPSWEYKQERNTETSKKQINVDVFLNDS